MRLRRHIAAAIVAATALAAATAIAPRGASAQTPAAVHSFVPGGGQAVGQEPEYFPANVLGLPDPGARRMVPSIDPRQIVSLGMGGEIVLRFDAPIVDGDGADLTVFENAFYYAIGPRERLFAEPAEVAASRDGINFVAWPFDTLTLAGCAGTAPTYGDRNPFDPAVSGGNAFDLAAIGLDSVRFLRIRDVTALVAADATHPYWDPTLSGFDLDAVVAIPIDGRAPAATPDGTPDATAILSQPSMIPNPAIDRVLVTHRAARALRVLDMHGRLRHQETVTMGSVSTMLDLRELGNGVYIVEIKGDDGERTASLLRIVR